MSSKPFPRAHEQGARRQRVIGPAIQGPKDRAQAVPGCPFRAFNASPTTARRVEPTGARVICNGDAIPCTALQPRAMEARNLGATRPSPPAHGGLPYPHGGGGKKESPAILGTAGDHCAAGWRSMTTPAAPPYASRLPYIVNAQAPQYATDRSGHSSFQESVPAPVPQPGKGCGRRGPERKSHPMRYMTSERS